MHKYDLEMNADKVRDVHSSDRLIVPFMYSLATLTFHRKALPKLAPRQITKLFLSCPSFLLRSLLSAQRSLRLPYPPQGPNYRILRL